MLLSTLSNESNVGRSVGDERARAPLHADESLMNERPPSDRCCAHGSGPGGGGADGSGLAAGGSLEGGPLIHLWLGNGCGGSGGGAGDTAGTRPNMLTRNF